MEFPKRIMDLLREVADKKLSEYANFWKDAAGPMQDAADAAITWIEAAQADRQFSDADQRDLNIGRAIQRAAMELPENAYIAIDLELGHGNVTWFSETSDPDDSIISGETFSAQIHAAIDAAIASVSPK